MLILSNEDCGFEVDYGDWRRAVELVLRSSGTWSSSHYTHLYYTLTGYETILSSQGSRCDRKGELNMSWHSRSTPNLTGTTPVSPLEPRQCKPKVVGRYDFIARFKICFRTMPERTCNRDYLPRTWAGSLRLDERALVCYCHIGSWRLQIARSQVVQHPGSPRPLVSPLEASRSSVCIDRLGMSKVILLFAERCHSQVVQSGNARFYPLAVCEVQKPAQKGPTLGLRW